jgi:hypothetical protein
LAAEPSDPTEATRSAVQREHRLHEVPYIGANKPEDRYRLVLRVVSVPPAYREQIVRNGTEPWLYFFKAGLVIRRADSRSS